jgi:hypothetical protein
VRNVVEYTTTAITNYIQDNIGPALDLLAIDRPDGTVTLENPVEYFNYEKAIGYKTPAVFVVPTDVDFRLNRGPNNINASVKIFVALVVEDRSQDLLQLKCFRYFDALHQILSMVQIDDVNRRIIVKVMKASFSGTDAAKSSVDHIFRKECLLSLEVEHYDMGM